MYSVAVDEVKSDFVEGSLCRSLLAHCRIDMYFSRHDSINKISIQETNPVVPDTGDINKEQMSKSNI